LQLDQYDLVGGFSLSIGLRMLYGTGDVFYVKAGVEFGDLFIYELSVIVGYDSMECKCSCFW